ncbi:MAG: GyrI-like domain-containing protein [Planctomycetaceae bacterium]|jgi:predicted transcriptional regulator YdeE|nr:GyrI-like domain-containing protein [Planctomycetaceae bacterium]
MTLTTDFAITIVDYPAKRLAGFRTQTTVPAASHDCSPLWRKFHSETKKRPDWRRKKSYGLFVRPNQSISLDFWTALEIASDIPVPEGMEIFELSSGKFVHCLIPNAADILMAYHTVYSIWIQSQNAYDIDMESACFELYPPRWTPNDAFDLYVPLKTKEQERNKENDFETSINEGHL